MTGTDVIPISNPGPAYDMITRSRLSRSIPGYCPTTMATLAIS
ncbi:hypothetical protein [Leifsonia sp. Root112D2]|nr:hypothetical protein [Leifsonia sp. Root112D2]